MLTRTFDLGVVKRKLLFKKGATLVVTSTAGVESTLSLAELAYLDITTAGTAEASKALVLDASKGISTITSATITTLTSTTVNSAALTGTTTLTMTSANASALAVGLTGATNPAFVVDSSTGSQAAGMKVTGATSAGTVAIAVISSGAAANLSINAKGSGTVTIPNLSCTTVIFGSTTIDETDAGKIDGITNGTSAASKALVLDAAESLAWATTDATASETCTLTVTDTRTAVSGAMGWAIKGELATNASLGSYANGIYGLLNFTGSGGGSTGLAAGVCAEIVMSAGTGAGTYAALELELGMPSGALSGNSGTSLIYAQVYGDDKTTFDTSGYLLNLQGVSAGTSKVFMNVGTATALADFVKGLRIKVGTTDYVIPLITAAEFAS